MNLEGTFRGVGEAELYYRIIKPTSRPKAKVIVVHGHGDHSGGLYNLLNSLIEHQFSVYALDLRGHGKSTGIRGFIRNWGEYRGDLEAFRNIVDQEDSDLPVFLIGHSLGGIVCLDYALAFQENIAGIITIAPAVSYEMKWGEKILVSIMSRIKPDYTIEDTTNGHLLTKDPKKAGQFSTDPLRHNTITPGLGRGVIMTIKNVMNQANTIQVPLLLQLGVDDNITPPGKLRQFFSMVGTTDKLKIEYEGMRHRPFDDIGKENFLNDMIKWLDEHI
ncbi:lysophospholipase [Aquibacillus koreensis]|uniref:Lysophospholipase n=1 Tax=Aquibacillus koreensis TaxID=279446 RepID=A0A9X4AK44_9BACI|nr:alpha/beta hydrolase [Aquibacillus koreensis]MCT2535154.1 lysophospholipase [Aquibacillus koreensis]MDC3421013.1 lysophospholipase [Aquibacillus koreensis]